MSDVSCDFQIFNNNVHSRSVLSDVPVEGFWGKKHHTGGSQTSQIGIVPRWKWYGGKVPKKKINLSFSSNRSSK